MGRTTIRESPMPHPLHPQQLIHLLLSLCCVPVWAAPPAFDLPIRCLPGQDCFIQNYFDRDPGDGWRDYACGRLSYDGHTGTDFRLPGMAAMHQGVAVLAAADGVIKSMRDGEPDIPVKMLPGEPGSGMRAAGNGVVIDHGDGWETQYSHMRQGSVAVRIGQQVRAGEPLGLVGLSGNTEFPHVDFSVRHNGAALDPFSPSGANVCAIGPDTLWKPETQKILRYQPTGLLLSGWSNALPERNTAENEGYPPPDRRSVLVFWVELFGVRQDDRQTFELFDPQGRRILNSSSTIPGDKAAWFAYAGKRPPPQGWPHGSYRAEFHLERKGAAIVTRSDHMEIP